MASLVALVVKNLPANAGDIRDAGLIPGSGRLPGGGHDDPLQYSCLSNWTGLKWTARCVLALRLLQADTGGCRMDCWQALTLSWLSWKEPSLSFVIRENQNNKLLAAVCAAATSEAQNQQQWKPREPKVKGGAWSSPAPREGAGYCWPLSLLSTPNLWCPLAGTREGRESEA